MISPVVVRIGETVSEMSIGAAVLAAADGLEVLDRQAGADARQHLGLLAHPILGNEDGDRPADHLLGGVAEHAFRAAIPASG